MSINKKFMRSVLAMLVAAVAAWQIDLREDWTRNDVQHIVMEKGEEVTVALTGSAGTGAEWFHDGTSEDLPLQETDMSTDYTTPGIVGGPLDVFFTFEAMHSGDQTLRMAWARKWEFESFADAWDSRTLQFTVADEIQDFSSDDFLAGNAVTMSTTLEGFVRLSLPENPTTGYRWTFSAGTEDSGSPLEIVYDRYERSNDLIGGGGLRIVTIQAKALGTYSLNFANARSWEEADAAENDYQTLTVNVK